MKDDLPPSMLSPRQARGREGAEEGWFYIDPGYIDVYASSVRGGTMAVRIYRRQLEAALRTMQAATVSAQ